MLDALRAFVEQNLYWVSMPRVTYSDVLEIIILAFFVYHIILWFKETRAWSLLKGIVTLAVLILVAYILQMNTILWLVKSIISVAFIALVVLFQPELRRALDRLGQKGLFNSLLPFAFDISKNAHERFSDRTVNEIVRACYEMGKYKTGALIIVERNTPLKEYEETGIAIDAVVSAPLLINIFEHNTPLHDGAVIVKGNRVTAATCYLPLSDSTSLNKSLGTRHRAGLGVSEAADCLAIIVSEETGAVSVALEGKLSHNITSDYLLEQLHKVQDKVVETRKKRKKRKGRADNEKDAD